MPQFMNIFSELKHPKARVLDGDSTVESSEVDTRSLKRVYVRLKSFNLVESTGNVQNVCFFEL